MYAKQTEAYANWSELEEFISTFATMSFPRNVVVEKEEMAAFVWARDEIKRLNEENQSLTTDLEYTQNKLEEANDRISELEG